MKLILSGGGNEKQSVRVDSLFVSLLKNPKVLYIPIALSGHPKFPYSSCLNWCTNTLNAYGDITVDMWTERELNNHNYQNLIEYGGVFIGGGNTFYLLDYHKKSGMFDSLKTLLESTDIPIIGGSAGALIFANSISSAIGYDPNDIQLTDLSGMDMVNGADLWVHYDSSMQTLVEKYAKKYSKRVYAIPEDSGVYVNDGNITCIGEVNVYGV